MTNRPVKIENIEVDPIFFIPEGVDELVYSEDGATFLDDGDFGDENSDDRDDDDQNSDIPEVVGIVSQTIRKLKSGAHVVDVVVEVGDIDGVDKYEYRVTKL